MENVLELMFVKTCEACPEQYDVYTKDNKRIGYVRLRWGLLRAEYIYEDERETVYIKTFHNDDGCFETEEDRQYHLKKIAKKLIITDLNKRLKE